MRKLVSVAVVTLLGTLGVASSAATKVVFNGSICQNAYPPEVALGQGVNYSQGRTNNGSGGFRYVTCPITRMNGGGGGITDLEVSVRTTAANSGTFCQAITADRYTGGSNSETLDANANGDQRLDFGAVSGAAYEGTYWVFCALANGASVSSIVVDES